MKKKVLALALSIVMVLSLMAGCSPSKDDETSKSAGDKETTSGATQTTDAPTDAPTETEPQEIAVDHFAGTTIEIVVVKKNNDLSTDWNEKEIFKRAEEATGIHVEWTVIDPSVSKDKIAVLLMSDDQPDVYLGALNENLMLSNLELFYDLSEEGLLETYAPKVVEDYNAIDGAWAALKWMDGSIRSLFTGAVVGGVGDYINSSLIINTEWLKKINKDIPTTADELYEVLVAFRDGDMDGDGDTKDEIPMSFCSGYWEAEFMMLANAFGIGGNRTQEDVDAYKNIKDGKVVSTVDTDNFRAFLEFHHKLYKEGLLDVEGFSQTSAQYSTKRKEKNIGVCLTYNNMMGNGYEPFIYQGMEGVEPLLSGLVDPITGSRTSFCISAESENVEAVLHWWNWMHKDQETKNIAWGGLEYFDVIDGKYYEKKSADRPEGYNAQTYGMHNYCPALLPGERAATDNSQPPNSVRMEFIEANKNLVNQEGFPVAFGDPEAAEERAFMESELFAYIKTFTANAVVNGVTDATWDQHLKELKAVQYYDWIQWYQDFVDEVNSR